MKPDYETAADDLKALLDARLAELECVKLKARPDGEWGDMPGASHWQCLLRVTRTMEDRAQAPLVVTYSMGSAHKGAPKRDSVFASVLTDSSALDEGFEDWCANYDYSTDSRKALATYELCRKQGEALRRMLGADDFAKARELAGAL